MPTGEHEYRSRVVWTGNRGASTRHYRGYDRTWEVRTPGKQTILCSNDPLLGGDPSKPNPEDLLLSALSACHMLWYLHLACNAGIAVHAYVDEPLAVGETLANGAGRFTSATLCPTVHVAPGSDLKLADSLHHAVHDYCFIARSVNFPVHYRPTYVESEAAA